LCAVNYSGPFGNHVNYKLIRKVFSKDNYKVKIGTYGFISGALYFIAGEVKQNQYCFEDYGYLLEKIILKLTDMGLGTCWLGGTFNRSIIADILDSEKDTLIPAITPVGQISKSKTLRENLIRWAVKSDNRLNWNQLFYTEVVSNPIKKEEIVAYETPLEMLRLAPSASNKQPWRIIKSNDGFHFLLQRTPGYNKTFKRIDLQKIDMGIAMSHFELTCNELGLKGSWEICNPLISYPIGLEYLTTWKTREK
jgi:nitroreductase